ncbi:hypothetical protein MLD38_032284 [Melastoma candidum]|uniref:Uncharacterized protein n=1 Tax=Melastoma candidum TaxID=119954 RepID=A0ACB9M5F4_9MYRT|nr:hypothetical protein MLD38_032284 [Melastoma candidum]
MAKEEEVLKKIELTVCVDCCDGCKKKVKKALQSVEGVLKTEINPQQQRVTVFGNVDPKVLIGRLARVGKQAEVWTQNAASVTNKKNDQSLKEKSNDKQVQTNSFMTKGVVKEPVGTANGEEGKDKTTKKNSEEPKNTVSHPGSETVLLSKTDFNGFMSVPPTLLQCDPNQKASGNQYIYLLQAQPMGIPVLLSPQMMPNMPYYAVCSYVAPVTATANPACYAQQNYTVERQSEAQMPLNRVGDYFNDENTMGCHVM